MEESQCSASLVISRPGDKCLTPMKFIGAGASGIVLKVSDESNSVFALKIVPVIVGPNNDAQASRMKRENKLYRYLANADKTPNLAKAIDWWSIEYESKSAYLKWNKSLRKQMSNENLDYPSRVVKDAPGDFKVWVFFVQMEFYTSGNLRTWLQCNSHKCGETYALRVALFCDIASAVDFLHKRGLMHRDICPNNIFLTQDNDRLHAVLGDFDSIVSCGEEALWPLTKVREEYSRSLGKELYAAPETAGANYDTKCDLYSLGVIALHLFFNIVDKIKLQHALYKISAENNFPTCPVPDKSIWLDILKAQLTEKPNSRIPSSNLLTLVAKTRTPFFADTKKHLLYLLETYETNQLVKRQGPLQDLKSRWVELSRMPKPRRRWCSVAACAGKLFVLGGEQEAHIGKWHRVSSLVEQYDIQTGWQCWPPMLEPRKDCGAVALGGRLFAVGGVGGHYTTSSAEECDIDTGVWVPVASMITARQGLGVAAFGNLLFAVGGYGGSSVLNSAEYYDPRAGRWIAAAPMHYPRMGFGCTAVGDRLYVAGGWTSNEEWTASMEWFDLRANKWSQGQYMGVSRFQFALAALNGQLLAAGGSGVAWKLLDTVELFDERQNAWTTLKAKLPYGQMCVGCVLE